MSFMVEHRMRAGDRLPALQIQLVRGRPAVAVPITGPVKFTMFAEDGETKIVADQECTVVNADEGTLKYEWGPDDTTTAGRFAAFVRHYDPDDATAYETFPNDPDDGGFFVVIKE
jgi:hypothetical protein